MMQIASRVALAARSARNHWRRLSRDEGGSVIALLAMLPVLAGAVAIGIETGQLYRLKRQMQGAADAAAMAGSVERVANRTATITSAAQYEAQRNGFTDGTNGVVVTVNGPPTSGGNTTTTGAVEVIITKSTGFSLGGVLMSWLGGTPATFDLRSRSVAAQGSYSTSSTSYNACIVALTTAAEQGINMTNFNHVTSDCTIASNGSSTSNNSSASIYLAGGKSSASVTAYSLWSRGSIAYDGQTTASLTSPAQVNQTKYIADPYASLPTPSPGSCTYTNYTAPSQATITLSPGTYCGGLVINGGVNNVQFTAGTYYVANGDLYLDHVNNVTCSNCVDGTSGVTIVLTQTTGNAADIGGFYIASDNNVTLSAPPTGTYAGVLVYQDRRVPAGTMSSTSKILTVASLNNATLSGAIYLPSSKIDISSVNNFGGTCSVWVGRYIKFSSFNNAQKSGCSTFNTSAVGVTTTTTVTKTKVFE